jgi:hypothetical protein
MIKSPMRSPTPFVPLSNVGSLKEKRLGFSSPLGLVQTADWMGDFNHDAVDALDLDDSANGHNNHAEDPGQSTMNLSHEAEAIFDRALNVETVMAIGDFVHVDLDGYYPPGTGNGDPDANVLDVTANENIVRGQPVYINNSNNQAGPAKAAPDAGPSYLRTQVVGFAEDTVSAGQTVTVRTEGLLTLANWTSIAGTTNLTTGVSYFLSETSGNITTTPPTTNNSVLIVVGRAVTPNTIDIEVGERIIL